MNGERFLNELYKGLNVSEEVMHTSKGTKDKNESVKRYMNRLERVHGLADNAHKKELIKRLYHKKYVVKEKDIPHGLNKNEIIKAQEESLDRWIDYLSDENTRYPMWAKYWAFQGMLKISTYSEETDNYQKRSKTTLAPFIEVNPEVLSKCIDMVVNALDGKELNDNVIKRIVMEKGNFQKVYTTLLKKSKREIKENKDVVDGIWVKYYHETGKEANVKEKQGLEPEYLKLFNSLNGYNTGWCTAGSKSTAKDQICSGDFYVYYTKNEISEYKIPRIAIRMNEDEIGEIRGVQGSQNLEEGLEDIVEAKLKELNLTDKEVKEIGQIISDSKLLTLLNKKQKNGIEFTKEELYFIYEVYGEIQNFGWGKDPRIKKIKDQRDINKDLENMDYDERIIAGGKTILNGDDKWHKISPNIGGYKEMVLMAVKHFYWILSKIPTDLEGYKEIALVVVKENGTAIKYVSTNIEGYKEIALVAVEHHAYALAYVPTNIEGYKEIALFAVEQDGRALEYVPTNIESYKEIAIVAVKKNAFALEYVPTGIEGYKEIVLEARKTEQGNVEELNKIEKCVHL